MKRALEAVASNVEEYLKTLSARERKALENLRKIVRSVVPEAEEVISYHIPMFKCKKGLVAYAAYKDHLSFFVMSSDLIPHFAEELKEYKTSKGTIQFTADKPLPAMLVRKIVEARVAENEANELIRLEKKRLSKRQL